MVCIYCGSDTKVINSRPSKRLNQIWRRRQCLGCASTWTTHETIDYSTLLTVKTGQNQLQPLQRDKLFVSILQSCQHRPTALADAAGLTATVMQKTHVAQSSGVITIQQLRDLIAETLKRFDAAAATHYQAFHPN